MRRSAARKMTVHQFQRFDEGNCCSKKRNFWDYTEMKNALTAPALVSPSQPLPRRLFGFVRLQRWEAVSHKCFLELQVYFYLERNRILWKCPEMFHSVHPVSEVIRNVTIGKETIDLWTDVTVARHYRGQKRWQSTYFKVSKRENALRKSRIVETTLNRNIHLQVSPWFLRPNLCREYIIHLQLPKAVTHSCFLIPHFFFLPVRGCKGWCLL